MSQLQRLFRSIRKKHRLCVGLLSGTSVDAAEAVVCAISGSQRTASVQLLSHVSLPFPKQVQARVFSCQSAEDIAQLNFELGHWFSKAALKAIAAARLTPDDMDVIGSHGQTLAHLPKGLRRIASTLQVGEASVICRETGIPTISDFRVADMAWGGEGAPLVPYADWIMFRKKNAFRALLNIGGIANVSVVGDALEDTVAFDTGPGNMMLDAITRKLTHGKKAFDRNGLLARQGTVMSPLLKELMRHPFLRQKPPKSTGRETFGEIWAHRLWEKHQNTPYDLLATVTAFTVESISNAISRWLLPRYPLEGIYVSGGGVRNPLLMKGLAQKLAPVSVHPIDVLGFPEGAKEAACFALLASEWLSAAPQNIPQVTGASKAVVLGKLSL